MANRGTRRHDDQRLGELQEGRGDLQARDSEFPLFKRNQRHEFSHTLPILKVARSSLSPLLSVPSAPSFPLFLDCQPPLFLFTLPAANLPPTQDTSSVVPPLGHSNPWHFPCLGSSWQEEEESPWTGMPGSVGTTVLRPWASLVGVRYLESPGPRLWEPNTPNSGLTNHTSGQ